ncbi:hypothetical protein [Actinomadura atramentaria]|uniref:hypothetical protein n=1 Tax=Actinomadura atramentaria TaxID=1990 RepID=UPI00036CD031|nr:hypothetical protein [Actinomadura atramentaria]
MRESDEAVAELSAACAADLRACMERYPALFPDPPMGPGLAVKLAKAVAWGAPWCSARELRPACRTSLWIFAVDWLIDTRAADAAEVRGIERRCLDVADGGAPADGDDLAAFLAELRADVPDDAAWRAAWRDELRAMVLAMGREWGWNDELAASVRRGTPTPPVTLEQYLGNADNFGSTWVNVAHWATLGDPAVRARLGTLRAASGLVQQILRLLNDRATLGRDETWGDLNAQLLGADETWIKQRIADLTAECENLLAGLPADCAREADYLRRQIAFSTAFYGGDNDYWDAL